MEPGSYLAITVLLILTGSGLPLPEEVPIIAAGILAANGTLDPWLALGCCLFGAIVGDAIMYWIGYHFGRGVLRDWHWWARRVTPQREARIETLFQEHGLKVFFVARFLVFFRSPLFLTAGILQVSFRKICADRPGLRHRRGQHVLRADVLSRQELRANVQDGRGLGDGGGRNCRGGRGLFPLAAPSPEARRPAIRGGGVGYATGSSESRRGILPRPADPQRGRMPRLLSCHCRGAADGGAGSGGRPGRPAGQHDADPEKIGSGSTLSMAGCRCG